MTLKAYQVSVGGEYCFLIHGETRSKAKYKAYKCDPAGPHSHSEWETLMFDFKLKRLPLLDDKPITYENAKAAGFEYIDQDKMPDENGDQFADPEDFYNDCPCYICTGGK